jgi:hypothetical protein
MSMEKIDHKAKAVEHLLRLDIFEEGEPGGSETLLAAQVHATLALVEQQRITNLIAIAALNEPRSDFTKPWDGRDDTVAWGAIRDQVAAGLNLA